MPTLSDYVDKIRNLNHTGSEPFNHQVFNSLIEGTALKSNDTDFMSLINESHHGSSSNIAYGDITDCIKIDIKKILRHINDAHSVYESWLMREKIFMLDKQPCKPSSSKHLCFNVPLYENIAAASNNMARESDSSFEEFNHELLGEYAIYQLRTNNFGFAAGIGYKAIVKLKEEPIQPNSLVIALHKNRVLARRYSKTNDGNTIVLNSEMLDFKRRPPSLVLSIEEVRLLEIMGFLFDDKDYGNNDNNKDEAILLETYNLTEKITMACKVRGDSAIPLALEGQVILGGSQIFPKDFDGNIGKLIALATNENEQVFKRIGNCVGPKNYSHLRIFDTIGGLGNSKTFRTEELEDDPFGKIPSIIPDSVREVLGVLYISV